MTNVLQRSDVEFAKRVFLDRLTTDAQPLLQPDHIDAGPGEEYEYGGVFNPYNFGVGADCSGLAGIECSAALYGPGQMVWGRLFSTESFAGWAQTRGFRQVSRDEMLSSTSPLKVVIMHGGGGPDSHMAMWLDGWDMESNGDHGVCTYPPEITGLASNFWNDWWVFDGTINENTDFRQPREYPQGADYAGGHISGAELSARGIQFVCRYITSGGSSLPNKQITAGEFIDLCNNGIQVVWNYETTATFTLVDDGAADAQRGLAYIQTLLEAAAAAGISIPAGYQPAIYFSADFDEAPNQDVQVENFLRGAATGLGGMQNVGLYGAYYLCSRAQTVLGPHLLLWQTEAWSGGNITSAVNIMQRNNAGYKVIGGVQCDINESHSDWIGAFIPNAPVPQPPPPPPPPPGPTNDEMLQRIYDQVQPYPQLAGKPEALKALQAKIDQGVDLTLVDAVSGHIYGLLPQKPKTKGTQKK
jgi:hypothetical protein